MHRARAMAKQAKAAEVTAEMVEEAIERLKAIEKKLDKLLGQPAAKASPRKAGAK